MSDVKNYNRFQEWELRVETIEYLVEKMVLYTVFVAFLAFRILSVFVVKTWYVPDEY